MKSHPSTSNCNVYPRKSLNLFREAWLMIIHLSGGLEAGLTIGIGPETKTKEAQGEKRVVPLTILPKRGRTTRIPSRRGNRLLSSYGEPISVHIDRRRVVRETFFSFSICTVFFLLEPVVALRMDPELVTQTDPFSSGP